MGQIDKEQTDKEYKRLQFDFSSEAVNKLDNMVRATEAASRAEVVRNALRLYDTLILWKREGYQFQIIKGRDKQTVAFPI